MNPKGLRLRLDNACMHLMCWEWSRAFTSRLSRRNLLCSGNSQRRETSRQRYHIVQPVSHLTLALSGVLCNLARFFLASSPMVFDAFGVMMEP